MFEQKKASQPRGTKHFSAKAVKFNRFLLLRYSLALFFFVNLNWFLILSLSNRSMVFFPLLLLGAIGICLYEQLKLYNKNQTPVENLTFTRGYLIAQILGNVFLIGVIWIANGMESFFPFLHDMAQTRIVMSGLLGLGILLALWNLKRIKRISQNKDKYYHTVLKTLKFESE